MGNMYMEKRRKKIHERFQYGRRKRRKYKRNLRGFYLKKIQTKTKHTPKTY